MSRLAACLLVVLAMEAPGAEFPIGESAPILHRNPFERPDLSAPAPNPELAFPPLPEEPAPWTAELRATMVAPSGPSLVNVDGVILGIGESYSGFELVEIGERKAVFERGEDRRELSMD